jgi:hypothetical protein
MMECNDAYVCMLILNFKNLGMLQFMSIRLTKYKLKTSCPVKYEYPNLMLLDLRVPSKLLSL